MTDADRAAHLRAIIDRPDDDLPRLVYADRLEESGEPERAEFIRTECSLGRGEHDPDGALDRRAAELFAAYGERWALAEFVGPCGIRTAPPFVLTNYGVRHDGRWAYSVPGAWGWLWVRGFIEEVECHALTLLPRLGAVLAAAPLKLLCVHSLQTVSHTCAAVRSPPLDDVMTVPAPRRGPVHFAVRRGLLCVRPDALDPNAAVRKPRLVTALTDGRRLARLIGNRWDVRHSRGA